MQEGLGPRHSDGAEERVFASPMDSASTVVRASLDRADFDPLTKLLGFPAFERVLVHHVAAAPLGDDGIAMAIGDVDGLKAYVEETNQSDSTLFGHLAGNRVMSRLGHVSRQVASHHLARVRWWCAATFGGDEIIMVADLPRPAFRELIAALQARLAAELPVTVSFALAFHRHPGPLPAEEAHAAARRMLSSVDRALFAVKRAAPRHGTGGQGDIVELTGEP